MQMFRKIVIMFVLFLNGALAATAPANAWGQFGHLTICDLAYRNLTDPAQEALKVMFHAPGGITVTGPDGDERRYTSFNVGCLEEDETPRRHPDNHFINVMRDTDAITGNTCPGQESCVLAGIERDLDLLQDTSKSDEERVVALMAIGHWVGDIHQPLHVSFKDDKGGNSVLVDLRGQCGSTTFDPTNLHAVWDRCLLDAGMFERVRQSEAFSESWGDRTITYRTVDALLFMTSWTEEKKLVGTDPWKWAEESYSVTVSPELLYCVMVGDTCQYETGRATLGAEEPKRTQVIDQAYLAAMEGVAEDRVRLAGFRLAHLLNLALDPDYTDPIRNSTQPE